MDIAKIASIVKQEIEAEPGIEGAFLSGSAANKECDEFSDIDIGIVSRDTLKDFRKAYGLREDILRAIGQPVHLMEMEWDHCKRVGALYGKSQYPPIGLKIDLVFSQLKHVVELMPQSSYRIIFDRTGELEPQLEQHPQRKTKDEIEQELKQHLSSYPFYLHDAVRAFGRKDHANAQSLTDMMRKAIYYTAAVRAGSYAIGSKQGLNYLSPGEKWILEHSYQTVTRKTIEKLTDLYISCLTQVQAEYQIEQDVEQFKHSLPELL